MPKFDDVILRWSIGQQNTVKLQDCDWEKFVQMVWLCKLSIFSFQNKFPGATCVLLFNGTDYPKFLDVFHNSFPAVSEVKIINQNTSSIVNPYHFVPSGVWWKWIPFRLDASKTEIAIDSDIICLSDPHTWYEWLAGDDQILVAPERYERVLVNTCGDFYKHPLLREKSPLNCGVVGQKAGYDFSDTFFEVTKEVKIGESHNSLFITEQGAINLWARILESQNYNVRVLDFAKNAWVRDFLYFIKSGVNVETVHAVTWHKEIVYALKDCFYKKVSDSNYTKDQFLEDILNDANGILPIYKHILARQIVYGEDFSTEILKSESI